MISASSFHPPGGLSRPPSKRRFPALAMGIALALGLHAGVAEARLERINLQVNADGVLSAGDTWDSSDGPGLDSGPSNGIVRTHDQFEYEASFATTGADQNISLTLKLPPAAAGTTPMTAWTGLPLQCGTGSSISEDRQTLHCELGDVEQAGTRSMYFRADVLGHAPNGTILKPPTVEARSANTPSLAPASTTGLDLRVSAAPFYDVRVEPAPQGRVGALLNGGPNGEDGVYHRVYVGMVARNPHGHGKKGVEQLKRDEPIRVSLDISGYPQSVRVDNWRTPGPIGNRAVETVSGSFADGCGSPNEGYPSTLSNGAVSTYGRVRDYGSLSVPAGFASISVAHGGDCEVLSSNRNTIELALHDVDSSLQHVPTELIPTTMRLKTDEFWIANKTVVLWTNLDDYPVDVDVPHPMRLTSVSAQSISGQAVTGDLSTNNLSTYPMRKTTAGSTAKFFNPDNSLPAPYATTSDSTLISGSAVNFMTHNQTVKGLVNYVVSGTTPHYGIFACEIIDRTAFDLGSNFSAKVTSSIAGSTIKYGANTNGQRYFASTDSAINERVLVRTEAEMSSAYAKATCTSDPAVIQWFDTWQEAEAAGGLVYVKAERPRLAPSEERFSLEVSGLILRETWAATIDVLSPTRTVRRQGEPIEAGTIIRNRAHVYSATMPSYADNYTNQDHLMVVSSQTESRLEKSVIEPVGADKGITVPAGTTLTYQLVPRYSTQMPPHAGTLTITDILPEGLRYVAGSSRVGTEEREPEIQANTPAQGLTTLTWRLENVTPRLGLNADANHLPAIRFRARAAQTLADNTVLINQASISGGTADTLADCTYTLPGGYASTCTKAARSSVSIQTPPGFMMTKATDTPVVGAGDPFGFTLSFVSMGREIRSPDIPDMIDILPFVGDGAERTAMSFGAREPASRFNAGAYRLLSVEAPAIDRNAAIRYTHRSPLLIHNDPRDPSNDLQTGSTRWCLATELGTSGCPASIAESTAVRISPTITSIRANQPYEVRLNLLADPLLSRAGDIFANRAGSRPVSEDSTLLYVESPADVHVRIQGGTASVAGRYFVDENQNNQLDGRDWALAGQCVVLSGTTSNGHTISLSTRTDSQGNYRFAEGVSKAIFRNGDCSGTAIDDFAGLLAGSYALSRGELPAGTLNGNAFAGTLDGATHGKVSNSHLIEEITLVGGQHSIDHHFTVRPTPPRLTLQSTIRNDQGGSATPADTVLHAIGSGTAQGHEITGASAADAVTSAQVEVGDYSLSADALAGYTQGSWQCVINGQPAVSGSTLSLGFADVAICTLEFDDQPSRLTLINTVENRHGNTRTAQEFRLSAAGPTPLSGATGSSAVTGVTVHAGAYTLGAASFAGYLAGNWQCVVGAPSSTDQELLDGAGTVTVPVENVLTLGSGQAAVCTIEHSDLPQRVSFASLQTDHAAQQPGSEPVIIQLVPVGNPAGSIALRLNEEASSELDPNATYELSVSQQKGFETTMHCYANNVEVEPRLTLAGMDISCHVERKRIATAMSVSKTVEGDVSRIEGTANEYRVSYLIAVKHGSGGDGHYDLIDTPAFDPDAELVSHEISLSEQLGENGTPRNISLPAISMQDGALALARQRELPMEATHTYRVNMRIRVPFGSSTANDSCRTGASAAGYGLYNQVQLTSRNDVSDGVSDSGNNVSTTQNACVATPVPVTNARLSLEKTSSTRSVEVGDTLTYRLRIRNTGEGPALSPEIVDTLPRGFSYVPGSVRVQNGASVSVESTRSRTLRFKLDRIDVATSAQPELVITYRVRVGVGSQEGDGVNRAHIKCLAPTGSGQENCSNESRWKVTVTPGVFTDEACVAGQIFVDCNGNSVKDAEELGIPGVRLYLQNGTWLVSDEHGKYSHCGLRPRTHVIKVDSRTLPRRSRLVTSSAQNVGDAHSLFIDAKKGMLSRADFIEGSCSPTVIEQVKARQAQVSAPVQTEKGQPALRFDSKQGSRAKALREGTDGASQLMSRTRH